MVRKAPTLKIVPTASKAMKIEKGIPLPPRRKYPLGEMEVGDSILVPDKNQPAISSLLNGFSKRHNKKFTIRSVPEGVRIWRIE